jgi:hypothetical protein
LAIVALAVGVALYMLNQQNKTSSTETTTGEEQYTDTILLNEIMAANKSVLTDENGNYEDWIEIYNPNDTAVNLGEYTLSNKKNKLEKWVFPNKEIAPKAYIVVFASGKSVTDADAPFWHTNFKLSKAGDSVFLSRSGKIADTVDFPAMPDNNSFGRSAENLNTWVPISYPTPGFENSENGYNDFKKSKLIEHSPVIITEAMPANVSTLTDSNDQHCDWVEIFNRGEAAINLKGYGLSDKPDYPLTWRFPDITIQPGEYLLIFASGDGINATNGRVAELHSNFRLSAYKGDVVLSDVRGRKLDSLSTQEIKADQSYARKMNDQGSYTDEFAVTSQSTPGYPNTPAGYDAFTKNRTLSSGPVIISEVMSSNTKYFVESDGQYYDWIELFNQSDQAVNLSGYGLTDSVKNPGKWRFGNVTMDPGEYLVVLSAGHDAAPQTNGTYIHTNFNLNKNGEVLALFDNTDKLVDKYMISSLPQNVSYGHENGKDGFFCFVDPTPGSQNKNGSAGYAHTPQYVLSPGIYSGQKTLEIKTEAGEQVYYTLDANTPTEQSQLYVGPITIDKTSVVRARSFKAGMLPSTVISGTYIINEPHNLPIITLVTDPDSLWDKQTGIYMEGPNASTDPAQFKAGANYYKDTEVPASFEVYDASGKRVFNQDIGLCMSGGLSLRKQQKSFAIFARSEYGSNAMQYSFFDNRPFTEYKSLVLRQGGRDITKIKEVVSLSLVDSKMNVLTQAIKPYVLYLNGQYWGVYYMMEKRNKYMIAAHEGAQNPDNMNILKGSSILHQGSNAEYKETLEYIKTHDMSIKENYEYVAARIDTDSFMDLMINEIYIANNDPGNLQFYQILPEGKWKQIYYDFCITFYSFDTLKLRMANTTAGSTVFNALLSYKPWRDQFIERFAWAIKEIYNPQLVIDLIDQSANNISSEIAAEHNKFSDTATVAQWNQAVQSMRNFALHRGQAVVQYLKNAFTLSAAQIQMLDDAIK